MVSNSLYTRYLLPLLLLAVVGALASCGGEGGVPEGGGTGSVPPTFASNTTFVAIGPASKTAPLEVNGISFVTSSSSATFETNDDDGRGLQPGMIVRVEATRSSATNAATATRVTSGAELRGTIESINRPTLTFSALGIAVDVVSTTLYDGFDDGIASIRAGDSVQVHGYPTGDNRIRATIVKKRDSAQIAKVTGTVTQAACTTCASASGEFQIGSLTVRPSAANAAPLTSISTGALVKATGTLDSRGVLIADSVVRYEGPMPASGVGVAIQGVLATVNKEATEFAISGATIRVDSNTQIVDNFRFGATLAPGNLLDVEGTQSGDIVTATKIVRR
jgi:hypothetical protein